MNKRGTGTATTVQRLAGLALVMWACFCQPARSEDAPPASGIVVGAKGQLLKDGKPFRAMGVNYYDAFARRLKDPANTSYREGFAELAGLGIPFVRFRAGAFMPDEWREYAENGDGYFALLDDVVRTAESHGIGLVPSLFWYNSGVPDFVGEPRNQWGNPESKTIAFMRRYTRDVVSRYKDSPAIWVWEFGNEYDLAADLPNAAEHRPGIRPDRGTPETRSEADDLRFDMVAGAFREFARTVRELDPLRPISTGNSLPRPSSHNQRTALTWTADSREEFARQLTGFNPDPVDLVSVHLYPHDKHGRFCQARTSYDEILALCMSAARGAGKSLFVGEWGARDPHEVRGPERDAVRRDNYELITALDRHDVPLAALWVYDFAEQEAANSVTSSNERKYLLRALELANHRIRLEGEGTHQVDVRGGNFQGTLLGFAANKGRGGNGWNPLQHARYRGENLFRDDLTGLYFEHIFNGAAAEAAISMFNTNNDPHEVRLVNESVAEMVHPAASSAWNMDSRMTYRLEGDAVEMEFVATPTRARFPLGWVAFMWASYMNHARERRIHFWGMDGEKEGWTTFGDDTVEKPEGFETGTVSFAGVPDLPYEDGAKTLNVIEHPKKKFLLPFYYGLVDGDGEADTTDDTMAYIMMFDQTEPIRFALWNFIKDSNGNPDPHSPAWDWQFVVRQPEPGKTYGYRARMLYVPFTGADDVRRLYEAWAASPKNAWNEKAVADPRKPATA